MPPTLKPRYDRLRGIHALHKLRLREARRHARLYHSPGQRKFRSNQIVKH